MICLEQRSDTFLPDESLIVFKLKDQPMAHPRTCIIKDIFKMIFVEDKTRLFLYSYIQIKHEQLETN